MNENPKLVTEPHNPYLLNTFRAFLAETQDPGLATSMTVAHVQHGQMAILNDIAKALEKISTTLTDPVALGDLMAFIRAGEAKRAESAAAREKAEAKNKFNAILRKSDAELAS